MAQISASMVKALREQTGAGMMDCKAALTENSGDMEAAVDWLKAKGSVKAAKKASRVAAEGLVGISAEGAAGAVVEVNSETDFVARNEQFQDMVRNIASAAVAAQGSLDGLVAAAYPGSEKSIGDYVTEMVGTIGENMTVRRTAALSVSDGVVASYLHNQVSPGVGKIGVLVAIESTGNQDALTAFGKQVAMHVAATNPLALTQHDMDPSVVDREKAIFAEQAREEGKPENLIEKIVEGKLRKFYQESVLLAQAFVHDPEGKTSVEQAAKAAESDAGAPVKIAGYVRMQLGEGIEKAEEDFAAEVAKAASGG